MEQQNNENTSLGDPVCGSGVVDNFPEHAPVITDARSLEKELCCICNGNGILPGENPLCVDHYQSEVIEKGRAVSEAEALGIKLYFDEDTSSYIMTFVEGAKSIFQVKMAPDAFEKLTNDMIKTVKNYNLYQAQKFQEDQKANEKTGEQNETELHIGSVVQDNACADCQCETQSE